MSSQPPQPTTEDLRKLTGAPTTEQSLVSEQDFTVETARSPRPLWTQPLPKLMMVAIALTPIVGLAGLFLFSSQPSKPDRPVTTADRQPQADKGRSQPISNELEQVRQENAHLKAKAALDGQQQLEAQTNKPSARSKTVPIEQPRAAPPTKAPQPVVAQSSPAPVSVTRSAPPRIVTASAQPTPIVEPQEISSSKQFQSEAEQVVDAMQRWQQLARLGSYGSVQPEQIAAVEWSHSGAATHPPAAAAAIPTARIAPTSAVQVSSRPLSSEAPDSVVVPTVEVNGQDTPMAIAPPEAEQLASQTQRVPILHDAEARILEDASTPPALIAGEHSPAVLTTPLVIDRTSKQQNHFTVVLTKPLIDSKGNVALPASAQLVVQVEEINPTGQVQLSATTAAWQEQGRTREISLPAGAIQVRGKDGRPLIARQFTDKGKEIAALDAGQFLLGAVRRSAQLYTRSNTRVQSGNGTTVVTEETPSPNILAGALEGGTGCDSGHDRRS